MIQQYKGSEMGVLTESECLFFEYDTFFLF